MSFKHEKKKKKEKKRNDPELSKFLWEPLREKKEEFTMSWKILAKVRAYSNLSKRFNLCIEEEYYFESPNGDAEQAQQTFFIIALYLSSDQC